MTTDMDADLADGFPDAAPWERRPDETASAYGAFCCYRDLGVRRSLRQAARDYYGLDGLPHRHGRTAAKLRQVQTWSSVYDWVERASAYSSHLDRMARVEHGEAAKLMARQHAAVASAAVAQAAERIKAITVEELSIRDAALLLDLGVRIERAARGQATEVTADTGEVEAAERSFREIVADNPVLAVAARELALAIQGAPTRVAAADERLTS